MFGREEIDPSADCVVSLYGIDLNGERVDGTEETFVINRAPECSVKGTITPEGINRFGNVLTGISCDAFRAAGFEEGDVVTAGIGEKEIDMPFCTDYQDVRRGAPLLVPADGEMAMWVSMGSFAEAFGTAVRTAGAGGEAAWQLAGGNPSQKVTISMKQKAGYLEEYRLRRELAAMKPRPERLPDQTEEEFANFREIRTTGMRPDTLFRSSSPIDDRVGRSRAADACIRARGIDHIINLYNSPEEARAMEGWSDTYASTADTAYIQVSLDYTSDRFREKMADIMAYIAENPGKYVVHCILGEHRTGAVCLILSALMGASYDEIVEDYMLTNVNLYGVKPGTKQYDLIVDDNVNAILLNLFGVSDPEGADLPALAEEFIRSSGVSEETIAKVKENLGEESPR